MLEVLAVCAATSDWVWLTRSYLPEEFESKLPPVVNVAEYEDSILSAAEGDALKALKAVLDANNTVLKMSADEIILTVRDCDKKFAHLHTGKFDRK